MSDVIVVGGNTGTQTGEQTEAVISVERNLIIEYVKSLFKVKVGRGFTSGTAIFFSYFLIVYPWIACIYYFFDEGNMPYKRVNMDWQFRCASLPASYPCR